MSQTQCTAPLNIVQNTQSEQICKLKCAYQFTYAPTTLKITNISSSLLIEVDAVAIPPVIYNDETYNIFWSILVTPSRHTYNGRRADAELIIYHVNTTTKNKYLAVCVPIRQSSTTTASSATFFDSIMHEVAQTSATTGSRTIYNDSTFTFNKFIPMTPFFSYTGTDSLFNSRCRSNMQQLDYIVFHSDNAITMSPQAFRSLRQLIPSSNPVATLDQSLNPGGLFYNPDGPVSPQKNDIYIDCRPTGEDGEILVPARQDTSSLIDTASATKILNFTFIKVIIGVILMMILWKLMIRAVKGITGSATKAPGVGGAKINI